MKEIIKGKFIELSDISQKFVDTFQLLKNPSAHPKTENSQEISSSSDSSRLTLARHLTLRYFSLNFISPFFST